MDDSHKSTSEQYQHPLFSPMIIFMSKAPRAALTIVDLITLVFSLGCGGDILRSDEQYAVKFMLRTVEHALAIAPVNKADARLHNVKLH